MGGLTDVNLCLLDALGREGVLAVDRELQLAVLDEREQLGGVVLELLGRVDVLVQDRSADCTRRTRESARGSLEFLNRGDSKNACG